MMPAAVSGRGGRERYERNRARGFTNTGPLRFKPPRDSTSAAFVVCPGTPHGKGTVSRPIPLSLGENTAGYA